VLSVRRIEEDGRKRAFGEAARRLDEQGRLVDGIGRAQHAAREEFARSRAGAIDLLRLRLQESYLLGLERRLRREAAELVKRLKVRDQRREELVEARRKVRVLERLRERRWGDHRAQVAREEQKELDETAAGRPGEVP
jgi:flagellar export protein FliJ